MSNVLIVGGGQAGVQTALSLRELGHTGDVAVIGSEAHAPYQRPPLSKAFLSGHATAESLQFRKPAFYEKVGIEIMRGVRVTDLVLSSDGAGPAGVAHLDGGGLRRFDHVVLATGGRPRVLAVPGADADGVCYLRTIDDATRLAGALERALHVVVIGGGFIGLEAAAMAGARGHQVTVVETADRLLSRAVSPELSAFLSTAHERRGRVILLGSGVVEIEASEGRATGVRLTDGRLLPADLVVIGVGMTPRLELAEQLGLEVDGGIVVDSQARTGVPGVHAVGDCTVFPHPITGRGRIRLESVQHAVDQAKVAAASIVGQPVNYQSLPWFWSTQGDLKIQMAGLTDGYDQVEMRGDPDADKFSVFYYAGGRLVAVHAVNRPQDFMAARKALTQRQSIDPDSVHDDQRSLQLVD